MIVKIKVLTVIACISIATLCCNGKLLKTESEFSDSLLILRNATKIEYHKYHGDDCIDYRILSNSLPDEIVMELNDRLRLMGWEPHMFDLLDTGIPTSHKIGWRKKIVDKNDPLLEEYEWQSYWTNKAGSVQIFQLQYQSRNPRVSEKLEISVFGVFIPADLVRKRSIIYWKNNKPNTTKRPL